MDERELVRFGSALEAEHSVALPEASAKDQHRLLDVTHREIAEMDCNPVMVLPHGAVVVDARIRVREPDPDPRFAARAGS